MIRANILAEYEAIDDNGQVFSDKEIHQFLLRKGIKNLKAFMEVAKIVSGLKLALTKLIE